MKVWNNAAFEVEGYSSATAGAADIKAERDVGGRMMPEGRVCLTAVECSDK